MKIQLPHKRRLTKQRQVILNILRVDYSHPNAEQVYIKVKEKLPRISLATVYRNLHFLVKMGLIKELHLPDQISRFDGHLKEHDHFVCNACKQVYNIPKYPLQENFLRNKNYNIGSFNLDCFGICCQCQDKEPCLSFLKTKKAN